MAGAAVQSVRRVVTGVDRDGRSAVVVDEVCGKQAVLEQYTSVDLWALTLPAPTSAATDVPAEADLDPGPGEVVWRWFALGPGERIDFHSTTTVDCMLVFSGSVTLLLEAGDVTLRRGDSVVQRGTRHGWLNSGDEDCVLVGLMASTEE